MVKRRKEEEIAGVLEFAGINAEDPEFLQQMQEHKDRNGGKLRVGKGVTGVRVMFGKEADLQTWRIWAERARRAAAVR